MISQESVLSIVERIVQRMHPDKVIVFGSWAQGTAGEDSDVDLLLVMELAQNERRFDKAAEARKLVKGKSFPIDVLVRTPAEIAASSGSNTFLGSILAHGKTLYAI